MGKKNLKASFFKCYIYIFGGSIFIIKWRKKFNFFLTLNKYVLCVPGSTSFFFLPFCYTYYLGVLLPNCLMSGIKVHLFVLFCFCFSNFNALKRVTVWLLLLTPEYGMGTPTSPLESFLLLLAFLRVIFSHLPIQSLLRDLSTLGCSRFPLFQTWKSVVNPSGI